MHNEFGNIIEQLTEKEKSNLSDNNISSNEGLISLLLKRVAPENVEELASLLEQSIIPSICSETDDEISRLFLKINADVNLLFDKEIQAKIEDFIFKRVQRDKKVVIQKTSDISKFVTLMSQYLNDAISSNGSGSKNVLNIKEKIQSINLTKDGLIELADLQNELIGAASLIEEEMSAVSSKLKSGKSKVEELEEKVKSLEEELNRTKNESMTDHLTGLLTRRAYSNEIRKIENSYQRNNTQYAVVFFDLDHFKNINDTYGHDGGDVILKTFAKVLEKCTRENDIVGRYGGEEFVAIVHFNLNRELLQYLKRVKTIVTANDFKYKDKKVKVTFSAGVAIRSNHVSYASAIQKADMLLYESKKNGRNQIRIEDGQTIS
ncbi:GGDEF domain-containing protein [Poseidonibacter sp.]|uniref:GGDEF domain-containing protein n=1 Tax=Poseidonibacter sp. TaxID=2321188 RepID=UPI003C764B0A